MTTMLIRVEWIEQWQKWQVRRVDAQGFTWFRRFYKTPKYLWRAIDRLRNQGDKLSPVDEDRMPVKE